jgi:hypothetical protein
MLQHNKYGCNIMYWMQQFHVTATPDVANLSAMEISFRVETLDNMMSPSKK